MAFNTEPVIDELFEDTDVSPNSVCLEPIWAGKKLTDKSGDYSSLREFITGTHQQMMEPTRVLVNTMIRNLALWQGIHYRSQGLKTDFRNAKKEDITLDSHKIIVNNIYDIERTRFSKITRNKPSTRPVPLNSDFDAEAGARVAGPVLETAKDRTKQYPKIRRMVRESFIFGESYIKTEWDRDKGELHPVWEREVRKLEKGKSSTMVVDGEEVKISKDDPIFIGDHSLKIILPWQMWPEPVFSGEAEDVSWVFYTSYEHVEVLKRLFNKDVPPTKDAKYLNTNSLSVEMLKDHALVYHVVARSSKFLSGGIEFKMTPDTMLMAPRDNPYPNVPASEWGNIPHERLTDIDVPGRLRGHSTIQILENLQHTENQMGTMIKHYLLLMGHPKFLLPREANVEVSDLSDKSMKIRFSGPTPPSMMVPQPVSPQIVAFWEVIRERLQKLGDLHGVSTGDLPKSVRAAKAIRLLQEIEDLRATDIFGKYNELFVAVDRKILSQMKHYTKEDGRLAYILGEGNEYLTEEFDPEVFSRHYDVKLEVNSGLPQQPSARAEFILEAWQLTNGELMSKDKLVKVLGFANEREFVDAATVSVLKSQRENDRFSEGKKVEPPRRAENHLVELREHYVLLQSAQFSRYPKGVQDNIMDHVGATEMLLWKHMRINPLMRDIVFTTVPQFPSVFNMPQETTEAVGQLGQQQQQQQVAAQVQQQLGGVA